MQLFEIFEYLFNRDQPGNGDAICSYFASHKPLHSPVIEPSAAPKFISLSSGSNTQRKFKFNSNFSNWSLHFGQKTNLTSLLLRTANTIRFDSKFRIIVQYSIRFEVKKHYSHSTSSLCIIQIQFIFFVQQSTCVHSLVLILVMCF